MIKRIFIKFFNILLVTQLVACASTSVESPVEESRPVVNQAPKVVVPETTVLESKPLPRRGRLRRIERVPTNTQVPPSQHGSGGIDSRMNTPRFRNRPANKTRNDSPILVKLLNQANAAAAANEWSKAENYLERAIRIDSKSALVWQRLSEIKLAQGKPHQAIQFARKSITLAGSDRGTSANSWGIIADANKRLNRPSRAEAALKKQQGLR